MGEKLGLISGHYFSFQQEKNVFSTSKMPESRLKTNHFAPKRPFFLRSPIVIVFR